MNRLIRRAIHHWLAWKSRRNLAREYNWQTEINSLHDLGVLCSEDGISRTTPMGKALVEMWTSTPLPKQAWIDPRTGERIGHGQIE